MKKTNKVTKRRKRKLLGIGHPYFFKAPSDDVEQGFTALMLLSEDRGHPKIIKTGGIGAWKKVKLYIEYDE